MSVKRYRDVSEMPPLPREDPKDPRTFARIRDLWRFSHRLTPRLFPPGVYRYRSIEERQAAHERATIERMRAMRAARTSRR